MRIPNLLYTAKAILTRMFIAIKHTSGKKNISNKQPKLMPKATKEKKKTKPKVSWRKELIKARAEINEIKTKKNNRKEQWN